MNNKNTKNHKNDHAPAEAVQAEAKDEAIRISAKELEELRAKSAERDSYYDKYLRAHSEFENAKKRMEKERADYIRYANDSIVIEFLPIVDNLEIAERHIKEAKDFQAVRNGVDMIHLQIQKYLKDIGVERLKTVGVKFDPNIHEAVEVDDASQEDDGTVVGELKPGYAINGRLIRPASVRIAKKKE